MSKLRVQSFAFGPVRDPWLDNSWQGRWGDEPPYAGKRATDVFLRRRPA